MDRDRYLNRGEVRHSRSMREAIGRYRIEGKYVDAD